MPFITAQQLKAALADLRPHRPLPIFSIPALTRAGVTPKVDQTDADKAAAAAKADASLPKFRGREEAAFVKEFFAAPGGPAGKPFFSPSNPDGNAGQWVSDKYSGSTLQAQRRERRGRVFWQSDDQFFPKGTDWAAFAENVRDPENAVMSFEGGNPVLVPLFALGCWLWRDESFAAPQDIVDKAKTALKIPADLVGTVYDDSVPADAASIALGADKLTESDFAEIIGAVPPPPPLTGGFADLVNLIEADLKKQNNIVGGDVVGQIVRAWAARDVVVLVGAGGTGKTTLAKGIVRALRNVIPAESEVEVPVTADFAESDLLGYENLAGRFVDRPLTARILRSGSPLHPHVLLLEELNLSSVDAYLSPILQAIESGSAIPLTGGESVSLPLDTLVLATCNSPRDEPESRLPMSGPTKRRATAIPMPNLLHEKWQTDGAAGIRDVIAQMLKRETEELQTRADVGRASWLDGARKKQLESVTSVADLEPLAGNTLVDVVDALLGTDEGKRWMTFGPLRDLVVQLVWADPAAQPEVLGQLTIGKVLQQVQSLQVAQLVAEKTAGLPNASAISQAVEEMAGPGGTVRALL